MKKLLLGMLATSIAMSSAFATEEPLPSVGVGIGSATVGAAVGVSSVPSIAVSHIAEAVGSAMSSAISATSHNASDSHTTTSHH